MGLKLTQKETGKICREHEPGFEHGFDRFTKKKRYSHLAAKDAENRTIEFLDKYLKTS